MIPLKIPDYQTVVLRYNYQSLKIDKVWITNHSMQVTKPDTGVKKIYLIYLQVVIIIEDYMTIWEILSKPLFSSLW